MFKKSLVDTTAKFSLAGGALIAGLALPACAEEPTVTPYRPTVSNPAQLSYPGWLELESGFNRSTSSDGTWRNNLPYTLKLAFTEDIGIMLGGDAAVAQSDSTGNQFSGVGDTLLLVKQRWGIGGSGSTALGVEYGVKAPTANTDLGSGKTDYIVNGIYSTDLNQHTIDLNLSLTQLGAVQADESKQQWGWATTWSHSVSEDWVLAAEFSGAARLGVAATNQFMVAGSYAMNRRVVWDLGVAKGISGASPQWSLFAGVSVLAGKVF